MHKLEKTRKSGKDKTDRNEGPNIRKAELTLPHYCKEFNNLLAKYNIHVPPLPIPNYDISTETKFNKDKNAALLNIVAQLALDVTNLARVSTAH